MARFTLWPARFTRFIKYGQSALVIRYKVKRAIRHGAKGA